MNTTEQAIELIATERRRQIEDERFNTKHDDAYVYEELTEAAVCYAMSPKLRGDINGKSMLNLVKAIWPFPVLWWKPTPDDRVRELTKAGALITAEIERLLRQQNSKKKKL